MASPDDSSPDPPLSPSDGLDPPILDSPSHTDVPPSSVASPPTVSNMTTSSQPLGNLNAARGKPMARPPATAYNADIMAKMKAFSISRQQIPTVQSPGPAPGGFPSNVKLPPQLSRPSPQPANSAPSVPGANPMPKGPSLAERRGGMRLPGGLPGAPSPGLTATTATPGRQKPKMTLSQMRGPQANGSLNGEPQGEQKAESQMDRYKEFVDTKTGALTFKGKAVVHGQGIDFSSGRSFSISLDEVDTLDELGKGNYGTVYKVRHSRPRFRRPGQGLAGNKAPGGVSTEEDSPLSPTRGDTFAPRGGTTGVVMAMKEMRLELEDAKFQTIIMELDVLHRCISPYIVDFYGAFFQEGSVYICMEFMDGGSIDKIYGDGIPEHVLRKITLGTTLGLKSLKEEHNIIHRDVKPTNILVNTRGQVKICDFGVSGNLVASIAKTQIGCHSYMAPERISSGAPQAGPGGATYSVQSDIWSLGLSIIECAMGRYPYPPETYDNVFSQLSAIVDGKAPDLPADSFSPAAHDFVAGCLNKIANLRPTYPMLLQHAWLAPLVKPQTILEEEEDEEEAGAAANPSSTSSSAAASAPNNNTPSLPSDSQARQSGFVDREVGEWVLDALDRRRRGVMGRAAKPALHTAPLNAVGSPTADVKAVAVDA